MTSTRPRQANSRRVPSKKPPCWKAKLPEIGRCGPAW